ncbi:MAG: serine hydroxymethyltransferase [Christensenellaceae bacterium]
MSKVLELIAKEQERQNKNIELIASENFVSEDVLKAVGSCLTNKYAEGYPGKRYYGGCEYIDEIESYCKELWQKVFDTDYHVNVQPHSGSNANLAAYQAVVKPGDTILSMELNNGAHLTHGSPVNASGKLYNFCFYGVNDQGFIDYNDVRKKAIECQPKLIVAGASAYSRVIEFDKFAEVADEVGAYLMVDMAHIAGLVATGYHVSPFGLADIVTTTTHKTLRGARGGLIFCKPELAKKVDSAIFPGTQGGPLEHVIAGKAVAAEEALKPDYKDYIRRVVENADVMAKQFVAMGYNVITGGTDNHMFLLDLTDKGVSGRQVQDALDKVGITLNKNCVPNETRSPMEASGVRIGTPAMTTKGFTKEQFVETAKRIDEVIKSLTK